MIVVDASVLATALADDGSDGRLARERLIGESLTAPDLIDLEVASAYRRLCRTGGLEPVRAEQALSDLVVLRLERVHHLVLVRRCWELRQNVTVYDGAYIALAEILQIPLLTADERLTRAPGARCAFELLG